MERTHAYSIARTDTAGSGSYECIPVQAVATR